MVTQHYRWDFIGLSTDTKPTPETSEKVVDGSTFYCSDNSKLYVFCKNNWYEKTVSGGGGGTSNFNDLANKPKYNGTDMSGTTDVLDGKAKVLTTADYNYPTNDPTCVAIWLLPDGVYTNTNGVTYAVTNVSTQNVTEKGLIVKATDDTHILIYEYNYAPITDGKGCGYITIVNSEGVEQSIYRRGILTTKQIYNDHNQGKMIQLGANSTCAGSNVITVGYNSKTNANDAIAIGDSSQATASNAISLGKLAKCSGKDSVSIGNGANTSVSNGVSVGASSVVSGADSIGIGGSAQASANYTIAIGRSSQATQQGASAFGSSANAHHLYSVCFTGGESTGQGVFNIGMNATGWSGIGYNSSNYRLLTGLYDGQSLHDASTLAQGNTLSTTAPTTTTEGVLGQLFTDTTNMHTYQCTAIDTTDPSNPSYTWTQRW